MIIRLQKPKDAHSEFVRVDFSLPCKESPEWVSTQPSIQKFHLFREKSCDAVLERSLHVEPPQDLDLPMWHHPPGMEHESLPFDQVIPCYRSVDLPLRPVV